MIPSIAMVDPTAVQLGDRLARLEHVQSVCVLGSMARGDAEASSDIDLLAVVDAPSHVGKVRSQATRAFQERRVQTKVVDEARLAEILTGRSTFAVHVLREAVVLHDEDSLFARLRAQHSKDAPMRSDPRGLRDRLELYDDLDWCQGLYLYCLADCYSVGRAAAFVLLSQRGIFEFSGPKALRRVIEEWPRLSVAAHRISALRPFFVLVERDRREPLPFPYRDSRAETEAAVVAAHELVAALPQDVARR